MCAFGFSLSIVINSASPFHFSFLSGSDHAAFSSVMTMGTRKTTTTITFTYQKEWRVCLGMSSLAPSPRPSQAYMTSAWPLWLVVIALLVTCELGHGQHSFQSDSSVCSSTFNVWKPEQDVLRRLEVTQLQIQNLSSFCQALAARSEFRALEQLQEVHNLSWRLEREVLGMQVTQVNGQLQATKMAAEVTNLRRELDNSNRRLDDLELDLYMLRTRMRDGAPRYEREQIGSDMVSLLKTSVGDLKAEWLLMKREIEALKSDTSRLSRQQEDKTNSSSQFQEEVRRCAADLQGLNKRSLRGEDLLLKLEGRVSKVMTDFEEMKDSLLDLKMETEEQRGELTTVTAGNIRLQKILHELQLESNRLRERQDVITGNAISGGRKQEGHGESQTDLVIQSSVGEDFIARDCHELYQIGRRTSSVYYIQPKGAPYLTPVYCLMLNGTGYTVIQRRLDGLLNFNRRWLEYQHGFGNPYSEFWLGNDFLHLLTNQKHYILRVDLLDWEGKRFWAEYSQFSVADASDSYRLAVSGFSGDAGDSLGYHDSMAFSTEDVDNDLHTRHCAAENQGGWWFNSCFSSNLNGVYHRGWYSKASSSYSDGVVWFTLKNSEFYSLRGAQMMLKPKTP
ncbi:angiopoietin-1-like isoform X2 [Pomacea canaliculata]|uniref:angiopoietin-1-like isoform X2 n=1 Tax=Pomacea canaliculata TaxID=400727 RepID=UPI000D72EC8B|nr:angiopoietin-1-like isoform X2 [Pomacea canaliculata]